MHFDNVVFLLLLAVAALFKWLTQKAQESGKKSDAARREQTSQTNPSTPVAPAESEEERVRRFLEALGQPSSAPPPRKITQRPPASPKHVVLPHVGPYASPLPPLTTQPPPLVETMRQVSAILPPPLPQPEPDRVAAEQFEAPVFEVQRAQSPSSSSRQPGAAFPSTNIPASSPPLVTTPSILTLLKSSDGVRQAVILREIFGPPRSLQTDFVNAG